jgi:hypothetical protein
MTFPNSCSRFGLRLEEFHRRRFAAPTSPDSSKDPITAGSGVAVGYSACLFADHGTPSRFLEVRDNVRGKTLESRGERAPIC